MLPTPPRRRLRVLAVAIGVAGALAVAEIALRVTHWGVWDPRQADYHFIKRADQPYWVADPRHPPEHVWDGDPYESLPTGARMTYPLNSEGFRGPEPDPFRPKVLFVGDSFTFGEGVAYEDTFVARVEKSLASHGTPPLQAIDAGVPGYGTAQEAARLPDLLREYAPRAVVVVYVPNDPIPLDDSLALGRGDLLVTAPGTGGPRILRLVAGAWSSIGADRVVEDWYFSYYFGARSSRWAAARASLDDMRRRCADAGASFGVVVFPILHRLAERPFARIHTAVTRACRDMDVPVLDLTDALAGSRETELWVHPTDHHPNARAHALAARAIGPFVEESLLR
jgi:GDSL-like lipase/acylhydrolase family protein